MDFNLSELIIPVVVVLAALFLLGLIFARLYTRASKEVAFVRTGMGGERVVRDGGALVFPVLHDTIPVNMNTLKLEVARQREGALITRDRMRVDVQAEFYVRVKPDAEAISTAGQTLGRRTMEPNLLKELVEGKFVDALRAVAAGMSMEELHENRVDFAQKVQMAVAEDLHKNGLELESVSLTGLDQTPSDFFNPQNAFDAQGLTKLTQEIERRRKERNDIERDTKIMIEQKDLETEQQSLQIARDQEYARLQQDREVKVRAAETHSAVAREEAERRREAEQARIESERAIREADIDRERQVEQREIERKRSVEIAEQEREIAISEKSREESAARAKPIWRAPRRSRPKSRSKRFAKPHRPNAPSRFAWSRRASKPRKRQSASPWPPKPRRRLRTTGQKPTAWKQPERPMRFASAPRPTRSVTASRPKESARSMRHATP